MKLSFLTSMKTRTRLQLLAGIISLTTVATPAAAGLGVDINNNFVTGHGAAGYQTSLHTHGYSFELTHSVTVTSLGVFDYINSTEAGTANGPGLITSKLVRIWKYDPAQDSEFFPPATDAAPLASGTVPAGACSNAVATAGSTVQGVWCFINITPVVLAPGAYVIGADYDFFETGNSDVFLHTLPLGDLDVASGMSLGHSRSRDGGGFPRNPGLSFTAADYGYFGPNFQVANPTADYGDAPDTGAGTGTGNYNTLSADTGPSHVKVDGLTIGTVIDVEGDGQPDTPATGDDTAGTPDDEDGIAPANLPYLTTGDTYSELKVSATNNTGSAATLVCWIDFNRNGDFTDTGEKAQVPMTVSANSGTALYKLTFTGFAAPVAGDSYIRCRIATNAAEVALPTGHADTGEVEDHLVPIFERGLDVDSDFGDAPDTGNGTGPGNYQTTDTDGGPSHFYQFPPNIWLGTVPPDRDGGALQNALATADDNNGGADEDGIAPGQIPTLTTTSTTAKMNVNATNFTAVDLYLACWIDFNRNGQFGDNANELATAKVPAHTGGGTFPLSYSYPAMGATDNHTYIRCRIGEDQTAPASVSSIGPGGHGEVEDYYVKIMPNCALASPITPVGTGEGSLSGITFTVDSGAPLNGSIKSVQCKKMVNISSATFPASPYGMKFTPAMDNGPLTDPYPAWNYNTPVPDQDVTIVARRTIAGSATLGCTVTDTAGNECAIDPVIEETFRVKGQPVTKRILDDGKPLSADFQYVKIINGSDTEAGLSQMEINVNGTKFKQTAMRDNAVYFLNIGSALRSDIPNSILVTGKGAPGTMASIFFADNPDFE